MRDRGRFLNRAGAKCEWSFLESRRREMQDCGRFWDRAKNVVAFGMVQARNGRVWSVLESCRCEMRDCGLFCMDRPQSS